MTHSQKCLASTRSGRRCQAWAVRRSDPARCVAHRVPGPAAVPRQAPSPLQFYADDPAKVDIDSAIAGLIDKMRRLDTIIASHDEVQAPGWPPDDCLIQLFSLYTQASSRLARLLRHRRALSGEAADGLAGAFAQALDELSTVWGIEL